MRDQPVVVELDGLDGAPCGAPGGGVTTLAHDTDVDISIQTTLASQVAVALQNARSFSQTQRQAERETTVNLITQKIQSATSVQAALQIAVRELGRATGSQTSVNLKTEQ